MDAGAGLHWAFRESFREYVTAIDDGRIDRRQVDLDAMGRFVFRRSGRSSRSLWVFEGRVDFWAHFGVLNFSCMTYASNSDHDRVFPSVRRRERRNVSCSRSSKRLRHRFPEPMSSRQC